MRYGILTIGMFALLLTGALLSAETASATQVRHFLIQGHKALSEGEADGMSVDSLGALRLARAAERLGNISEPFLLAAAEHPEGWVLGTGSDGRVLLLTRAGEVQELFQVDEPEVFSVWADSRGVVFAGSSPSGRVYRHEGGETEPFFEPGELYIWDLVGTRNGDLLVATGTEGRLYRVTGTGDGSVLWDSEDTHIRSLLVLPEGGGVLAGTAGDGLVARIAGKGGVSILYNADQPEIVDLARDDTGRFYVAAMASEASSLPSAQSSARRNGDEDSDEEGSVSVTVSASNGSALGSRPSGFQGPRSEIVVLGSSGVAESLWSSQDETLFSLAWSSGSLWAGTGLEGILYRLEDGRMVVEKDLEEKQIVALLSQEKGVAVATTNGAAFYRVGMELETSGSYTGPPMDTGSRSRFGSLRWRGTVPETTVVKLAARSGNTPDPDPTWSPWTSSLVDPQIQLGALPPARYVQWRAEMEGDGAVTPVITSVELAYRQDNLAPRIESLEVLDPGQILVPSSFNPSNQVYEPAHPNRDGIFTTLEPERPSQDHLKSLWKMGYRTLKWKASDPNGDDLVFALELRRDGDAGWIPVVDELEESRFSFDATVIPDGLYRFRLRASDERSNPPTTRRAIYETSQPVVVDHNAPGIVSIDRRRDSLVVVVEDPWNALREASVSIDGRVWQEAVPEDGLLDGPREQLVVEIPQDCHMLLLRLVDAAFNGVTVDLLREAP
jgi:hypothetical protein